VCDTSRLDVGVGDSDWLIDARIRFAHLASFAYRGSGGANNTDASEARWAKQSRTDHLPIFIIYPLFLHLTLSQQKAKYIQQSFLFHH
jgi:hypothetical protein